MKALVLGASGATGRELLNQLSGLKELNSLQAVLRREAVCPSNCQVHVRDFSQISEWQFQEIPSHVFCAVGTTIKQAGSKEQFKRIDQHLVIDLAQKFFELGATSFSYVSSMGANHKSMSFYLQSKGETEQRLQAIGFDSMQIFRPGLLLTGERPESRPAEAFGQAVMRLMNPLFISSLKKYRGIPVEQLASFMIQSAGQPGSRIIEAEDMLESL